MCRLLGKLTQVRTSALLLTVMVLGLGCAQSDGAHDQEKKNQAPRAAVKPVPATIAVGSPAPDFKAKTLESRPFRLSDYRGQFVLIDFWGTWCRPCLGEIPYLKKANQAFDKSDLQIVSIAMDQLNTLKAFVAKNEMSWIQIHQEFGGPLLSLYKINSFPTTILVNPEGIIVAKGIELRQQNLQRTLQRFLAKAS